MVKNLQQIQVAITPILKEADVSRCFVFGSYARNEARPESDIDFIVEFSEQKSLLDLVDLQLALQDCLDAKVDVTTPDALSKYVRKYVEADKVQIL